VLPTLARVRHRHAPPDAETLELIAAALHGRAVEVYAPAGAQAAERFERR